MIPARFPLRAMTALFIVREDRVLLLWKPSGRVVRETWCPTAGGHIDPGEHTDPFACLLRELREETGLGADALSGLSFRYVTLRYAKDEMRENFYWFASLRDGADRGITSNEGRLEWFPCGRLKEISMPWTARAVLDHWFRIGRFTEMTYAGTAVPEGAVFTPLEQF